MDKVRVGCIKCGKENMLDVYDVEALKDKVINRYICESCGTLGAHTYQLVKNEEENK